MLHMDYTIETNSYRYRIELEAYNTGTFWGVTTDLIGVYSTPIYKDGSCGKTRKLNIDLEAVKSFCNELESSEYLNIYDVAAEIEIINTELAYELESGIEVNLLDYLNIDDINETITEAVLSEYKGWDIPQFSHVLEALVKFEFQLEEIIAEWVSPEE